MKRFSLILGLLGLGILSAACSGGTDEPAPFAEATDLESRMAADLGTTIAIEQDGHSTIVIARGTSRAIAANDDTGEGVLGWIERYADDLGMTASPRLVGIGTDGAGLRHVRLGTSVPAGVQAPGLGWDVVLDSDGRLVAVFGKEVPRLSWSPKLSDAEAIARARKAANGSDEAPPNPPGSTAEEASATATLSVWTPDEGPATLAYEVRTPTAVVWIDAHDGAVLADLPLGSKFSQKVTAPSAHHYYGGRRNVPGAAKTIEVEPIASQFRMVRPAQLGASRIEVHRFAGIQSNGSLAPTSPLSSPTPSDWDTEPLSAYPGEPISKGVAVDAAANAAIADSFFVRTILRSPVPGGNIRVVVHENHRTRDDKGFDIAEYRLWDRSIHFSDGEYASQQGASKDPEIDELSPAVALDLMGHELTHAVLNRSSKPGMRGSYDEGLADVMGQLIEHEGSPGSERPERAGEGASVGKDGVRNLAHPDRGTSEETVGYYQTADHYVTRKCLNEKGKFDPRRDPVWQCAHVNSTIVSHAWHLTTFGGKNNASNIIVEKGIGWTVSEKLWTALLGPQLTTTNGTIQLAMVEDIETAARAQVAHARLLDVVAPGTLASVACAWQAVGALDVKIVGHLAGVTCRLAQPRQCAGKANGWHLDEAQEFAAVKCIGGSTAEGHQCPEYLDRNGLPLKGVAKRTYVPRTQNRMFDGPVELDPKTGRPTCVDPWR